MDFNLKVEKRAVAQKKSDSKNIRNAGYIPAIIYGDGKEGVPIKLKSNEFVKAYNRSLGELVFFNLDVDGKNYKTVIKSKQVHPSTRRLLHIDFMELTKGHTVTVDIPIKLVGDSVGVREGGIVDFLLHTLSVSCLPSQIVSEIEVDISNLAIGENLRVQDINLGKLHANVDPENSVVNILPPIKAAADSETEGEQEGKAEAQTLAE